MPSYKPCPGCGGRIQQKHSTCLRCYRDEKRTRIRPDKYEPCPHCGRLKRKISKQCAACAKNQRRGVPLGTPLERAPAGPSNWHAISIIRTIDAGQPSSWRPPHYPPPCPECNGFGYRRYSERDNHTPCRDCRGTGHAIPLAQHIRDYVGAAHA